MTEADSRQATAGTFIPAAGRRAFTSLYDPVMDLVVREGALRRLTLRAIESELPAGGKLLDIGSGTGSLAIAAAEARPDANVLGVDIDDEIRAIAAAKPGAERVTWQAGSAIELPLADNSADVAVISLVLHHLQPGDQVRALHEAHRVLRDGGTLVVADWGRPRDPLAWLGFVAVRLLDGFSNTGPHARGELPSTIGAAGFDGITTIDRLRTAWGVLELIVARSI